MTIAMPLKTMLLKNQKAVALVVLSRLIFPD